MLPASTPVDDTPGHLADATPNPTGWIAPTEAGRAQQLLATQPHLVQAQLELRWLPNAKLLAHATSHQQVVGVKTGMATQRPALTATKKAAIAAMSPLLTELRGLLKKKFKDSYEAYYPQFGLVRRNKNWELPRDQDELIVAVRDYLLPGLAEHGFAQDADTGAARWQPLLDQLSVAHAQALTTDESHSESVALAGPQDAQTTKALRAIFHLVQAHFPDAWEPTLRAWGWHKTSF